jgi:Trypsin
MASTGATTATSTLRAMALLWALGLAGSGCLSDESWQPPGELMVGSAGIIGGTETQEWEPIGAYYQLDNGVMCTTTLVAEDVVLLAAHCVEMASSNQVFFVGYNVDMLDGSNSYDITECFMSPSGYDTAVCLLAEPLTTVETLPINLTPFDETWDDQWFHYVGFGVNTGYGGAGAGLKRETDIQMNQWDAWEYSHFTEGTNTCSGDSGGPSLVELDGHYYVAGVNSSVGSETGDPCSGFGIEMRVDAEIDFLDDYFDPLEYQPDGDDDDDELDDDDQVPGPTLDGGNPFAYSSGEPGDWSSLCSASASRGTPWSVALLALLLLARIRSGLLRR